MSEDKLRQLSTYLRESDELYEFVMARSKDYGISVSDTIRMMLSEQMRREVAEYRARIPQFGTVTP